MKEGGTRRVAVLLDCAAVFAATLSCVVLVPGSRAGRWESSVLGRPFIEYLVMLAVPLIVLVAARRTLPSHGLWLGRPYYHLTMGLTAAAPFAAAHAVGFGAVPGLERWGAFVQSGLMLAALGTVVMLLRNKPSHAAPSAAFVLIPAIGATPWNPGHTASAFVFYTLFLAPGEEVLFRGYIQSRLNSGFGCPFNFAGVRWGWGLVLAAVFFALFHVLNLPAVAAGELKLQWSRAMPTFVAGLLFGYLREKTGSIAAGVMVHGLPQGIAWAFLGR